MKPERFKGRVCERFIIALPLEATEAERVHLVRAFCEHMTKQKAGFVAAVHDITGNDKLNPHAHIVLFDRFERSGGRGRPRSVIGLARKNAIEVAAQDWAQIHNRMMKNWGYTVASKIDHRSYAERGIDRVPTIHEGPAGRAGHLMGKATKPKPEWKHIDAGHRRAEANEVINQINQSKEHLNDRSRLGARDNRHRDRSQGGFNASGEGGRGRGSSTRSPTPPFIGAQSTENWNGASKEADGKSEPGAGSNYGRTSRGVSENFAQTLFQRFRRWRRMRRVFIELLIYRDILQARIQRLNAEDKFNARLTKQSPALNAAIRSHGKHRQSHGGFTR